MEKYTKALLIKRSALPWWGTRATMDFFTNKHQLTSDETINPEHVLTYKEIVLLMYVFFDASEARYECRTSIQDIASRFGHKAKTIDTRLRDETWGEVTSLITKTHLANIASVKIYSDIDKKPLVNHLFKLMAVKNDEFESKDYVKIDNVEHYKLLMYGNKHQTIPVKDLFCFYVYMKSFFGNLKHDDPAQSSRYFGYGGWRLQEDIMLDLKISTPRLHKLIYAMLEAEVLYEWPDRSRRRPTIYTTVNDTVAYTIAAQRQAAHVGKLAETRTRELLAQKVGKTKITQDDDTMIESTQEVN